MSEFYIGYSPKAPERLGRTIFRVILALNGLALAVALLLVFAQHPFANSTFEYLQYRDYDGVITESPYPSLLTREGRFLLVAPGKRGAQHLVHGFDLQSVRLRGSLIRRGDDKMLEIVPASIMPAGGPATAGQIIPLGVVTLSGEIADSKCYFGVMNPGNGKVHRDCAVRCISGGIPPVFVVKDAVGVFRSLILTGADGRKAGREVLDFVAQHVQISGHLIQTNGALILKAARIAPTRE